MHFIPADSLRALRMAQSGELRTEPRLRQACADAVEFIESVTRDENAPIYEHAARYGQTWSAAEESELRARYNAGEDIASIASILQRTPTAIRRRLQILGFDLIID